MLGHRGCRLGIVYPEISEMQARAIFEAAAQVQAEGIKVRPEVMIPLVGFPKELKLQIEIVHRVAKEVAKEQKTKLKYLVGTMIEIPRAALAAEQIAEDAEFFSFGTNDLTQTTLGMSRDDSGSFLPDLPRTRDRHGKSVRFDRPGRCRRAHEDRSRSRQEDPQRHQTGNLRRTRRRTKKRQILPRDRSGLRELLAVSRANRPTRRRASGARRQKVGKQRDASACVNGAGEQPAGRRKFHEPSALRFRILGADGARR